MMKSLCLIPAKGNSIRLPRKNVLPLDGKPMINRVIEKAISSSLFDEVAVSTEDKEIADLSRKAGASVPFIRPEELSKDPATLVDVILHALEHYQKEGVAFDKVCVLLPTTPFLSIQDIQFANELFDNNPGYTVFSVSPSESPPFNSWIIQENNGVKELAPCFPDSKYKFTKSTECPTTYRSNGAVLITGVLNFLENKTYREDPMMPYVMPADRSIDIDTPLEYQFSKFLIEEFYPKDDVKERDI